MISSEQVPKKSIEADYIVETALDPERAVADMAGEQSSGNICSCTWRNAGTEGKIGGGKLKGWKCWKASIIHPFLALPPAMAKSAGRMLLCLGLMRILGVHCPIWSRRLPETCSSSKHFPVCALPIFGYQLISPRKYGGPKFGVAGTRRLCGTYERPLIGNDHQTKHWTGCKRYRQSDKNPA